MSKTERLNSAKTLAYKGKEGGYWHWCPGCESAHRIPVEASQGPSWTFNGDMEKPTFKPSVRCFTNYSETEENADGSPKRLPNNGQRTLCHYFLTDGVLWFCADTPHAFGGKSTPLPPLPDWLANEE